MAYDLDIEQRIKSAFELLPAEISHDIRAKKITETTVSGAS